MTCSVNSKTQYSKQHDVISLDCLFGLFSLAMTRNVTDVTQDLSCVTSMTFRVIIAE